MRKNEIKLYIGVTLLILMVLMGPWAILKAYPKEKSKGRVIIRYRKHTSVDLTGNLVQGKVRTPAVFYIFQRRRSKGHQILSPPSNLKKLYNIEAKNNILELVD